MKEYKKPSIKVNKITDEGSMLMSSPSSSTPTSGLDNPPQYGGASNGTQSVSAKRYDVWDYVEDDGEE